jgi:hypothetical protein
MARRTPQVCPGPGRPAAVGPVRDGSRRTCCRTPPPPEPVPWIWATSSAVLIGRLGAPSSSCPGGVDHRRSPEQPVPRGPWGLAAEVGRLPAGEVAAAGTAPAGTGDRCPAVHGNAVGEPRSRAAVRSVAVDGSGSGGRPWNRRRTRCLPIWHRSIAAVAMASRLLRHPLAPQERLSCPTGTVEIGRSSTRERRMRFRSTADLMIPPRSISPFARPGAGRHGPSRSPAIARSVCGGAADSGSPANARGHRRRSRSGCATGGSGADPPPAERGSRP